MPTFECVRLGSYRERRNETELLALLAASAKEVSELKFIEMDGEDTRKRPNGCMPRYESSLGELRVEVDVRRRRDALSLLVGG